MSEDFEYIGFRIPNMVHHLTFRIHRRVYTFHPTGESTATVYPQYHILDDENRHCGSLWIKPNKGSNSFDGTLNGEKIWISYDKVRRLIAPKAKPIIQPVLEKKWEGLTDELRARIKALPKMKASNEQTRI